MERFKQLVLKAATYCPTAPRGGDNDSTWLRLRNLILTGFGSLLYFLCYKGSLDLNETIPLESLTGTLTAALGVKSIVGSGTLFTSELQSGQRFFSVADHFMVDTITDDTHMTVYRGPTVTALTASAAKFLPVIFDVNRKRGTLRKGNAVELQKGSIVGTGFGTLRLNGSELPTVVPVSEAKGVGTGADDAVVGTMAWTNPGNITAAGGGGATSAPVGAAITTHYLKGTNCGFSAIPGGATITGIAVTISKRVIGATLETVTDSAIRIVKPDGSIGTTDRSSGVAWPNTNYAYSTYGGPSDLWGESWVPADFADADVGAVISAVTDDPGGESATLDVDYMFLTVYYVTASGTSMVLTGSPKIALYNRAINKYAIDTLGLPAPTTSPTITSVAGGTHGMIAGDYSLRMVRSRSATDGYGNPGPRTNFSIMNDGDFAQVDSSTVPMIPMQDGWDNYATQSAANRNQGPWDFVRTVLDTEGAVYPIDYLDGEIGRQGTLDYDNDPPPASGFIASISGALVGVSCDGKYGASPGPAIAPFKPQNIEAAPAGWHVKSSPSQDLLGVVNSQARLYFPTNASLQTGVFADTGDPLIPPVTVRSYWNIGFSNHQQVIFAANQLIGYPHSGPTRSVADQESVEEQYFGDYVAEIIKDWIGSHVMVEHDPDPNVDAVCFFHPAHSLNSNGFWTTRVLLWGLRQSAWIGDVLISSSTRDMIVCSVAKVGEHLEFLAGGRLSATVQIDTFRWNQTAGVAVDWFAAPQLTDGGSENQNKSVKSMRATGKFTAGNMRLYGWDSAVNISLADIESGSNSVSGNIALAASSDVQQSVREPMNFPNLAVFSPRVSGTYSGTGDVDRLDELVVEFQEVGNRR